MVPGAEHFDCKELQDQNFNVPQNIVSNKFNAHVPFSADICKIPQLTHHFNFVSFLFFQPSGSLGQNPQFVQMPQVQGLDNASQPTVPSLHSPNMAAVQVKHEPQDHWKENRTGAPFVIYNNRLLHSRTLRPTSVLMTTVAAIFKGSIFVFYGLF